jgi:hypothetical protein
MEEEQEEEEEEEHIQNTKYWFGVAGGPSPALKRPRSPKDGQNWQNEPKNGQRQAISYYKL